MSNSFLDEIASADDSQGGNWMIDGDGIAVLSKLRSRKNRKGHSYIDAEVYIESALPKRVLNAKNEVIPNAATVAAGEFRTFSFRTDDPENPGRKHCKALLLAATHEKDSKDPAWVEKFKKIMEKALSEEQRLRGAAFRFASHRIMTKAQKEITTFKFDTVPQTKELIAQRRQNLEQAVAFAKAQAEQKAAEAPSSAPADESDPFQ